MNEKWETVAPDGTIKKTINALKANNIAAEVVNSGEDAKKRVMELLPKGAEVMNMTSVTLETISVAKAVTESGEYNAVRNTLTKMDRKTQSLEMQKLGSAPEWVIGSVHAVTEDGKVLIASNTGSQLPAYVYGSAHVIWVVGAQKIVANLDEGMKRIYEYILPLESVRLNKAYNIHTGSFVSKLLIINREIMLGRITMILVKEKLGF